MCFLTLYWYIINTTMPISLIPDSHITFYISSAAMMQSAEKTGLEPVRRHIPVNGSFRNYCLTILGLLLHVSFEFFGSRTVTIIDFPFRASVLVPADYRATGRNRTRCLRITEATLCHMSCCGKCPSFRAVSFSRLLWTIRVFPRSNRFSDCHLFTGYVRSRFVRKTRIRLATSGLEGRHSNQLNYFRIIRCFTGTA